MMNTKSDQAEQLRQLVRHTHAEGLGAAAVHPHRVVVAGGKGGVGVTTIAVRVAVRLAQMGRRTLLVDANVHQPDIGAVCQIDGNESLADVLSGWRTLSETIQPGPAGIHVLPGTWAPDCPIDVSSANVARLISELDRFGNHVDVVIVDVGSGAHVALNAFWQTADQILLVTTPDSVSVMDTYATIKMQRMHGEGIPVITVVNRVDGNDDADEIHQRLRQACQRFLGIELLYQASISADPQLAETRTTDTARALDKNSAVASELQELAALVLKTE